MGDRREVVTPWGARPPRPTTDAQVAVIPVVRTLRAARSAVAREQDSGVSLPARKAAVALVVLAAATVALLAGCSAPVKPRPSAELAPARGAPRQAAAPAVAVDPALFAPGAGIALAPRAGNRRPPVFLAPAHA